MSTTPTAASAAPEPGNVIQLALFGDPVTVDQDTPPLTPYPHLDDEPARDPIVEAAVEEVMAAVDAWDHQLDQLLEGFPELERPAAQRLVYKDANGDPATRYGLLRLT